MKVGDLEIDEFLREQKSNPRAGAQEVNIAQMLVAVPERASEAQVASLQQKAQGIAQRARSGEDFAKLARELSDAPGAAPAAARWACAASSATRRCSSRPRSRPGSAASPGRCVRAPVSTCSRCWPRARPARRDAAVSQSHARHILLRVDGQRTDASRRVAQLPDFKRRVQAGTADFAGLARDNSQDGSAKDGGDLGWRRTGDVRAGVRGGGQPAVARADSATRWSRASACT